MARLKKPRRDIDEYGSIDVPYDTQKNTMERLEIYPIRGRSDKARRIESWLYKGIVLSTIIGAGFVTFSACDARSSVKNMDSSIEVLENDPSFAIRYPELGATIIEAYYAGTTPPVNLLETVVWAPTEADISVSGGKAAEVKNLGLSKAPVSTDISPSTIQGTVFTNPRMETLTYIGSIDNKYYQFTVNLIIPDKENPTIYPYLAAAPAMEPLPMFVQAKETLGTPEGAEGFTKNDDLGEDTRDLLSRFAVAYSGDDRTELKSLTDDDDPNNVYYGISGYMMRGTPNLVWAYKYTPYADNPESETFTYARIAFQMERTGDSGQSRIPFVQLQTMDLLLSNQEGTTPRILAWGPAGTWTSLKQGMNAVRVDDVDNNINNGAGVEGQPNPNAVQKDGNNTRNIPAAPTVNMNTSTTSSSSPTTSSSSTGTSSVGTSSNTDDSSETSNTNTDDRKTATSTKTTTKSSTGEKPKSSTSSKPKTTEKTTPKDK